MPDANVVDAPKARELTPKADRIMLAVGVVLILLPLAFVVAYPQNLDGNSLFFLRIIASLGGALIGASLPGLLNIELPGIRAGGALAVLAMFYLIDPPGTVGAQVTHQRLESVLGKITKPAQGSMVEHTFASNGTVGDQIPKGVYLYLAVEINGAIWPKTAPLQIRADRTWSATVFQDSDTPAFSLSLIASDEQGRTSIQENLDQGLAAGGIYQKMNYSQHIVRRDRVGLRLKQ